MIDRSRDEEEENAFQKIEDEEVHFGKRENMAPGSVNGNPARAAESRRGAAIGLSMADAPPLGDVRPPGGAVSVEQAIAVLASIRTDDKRRCLPAIVDLTRAVKRAAAAGPPAAGGDGGMHNRTSGGGGGSGGEGPPIRALRGCIASPDTTVRGAALRALRYIVTSAAGVGELRACGAHLHALRALEREPKFVWERMQALKLVRHVLHLAPEACPRGLVRSLVAVALHEPDNFRRVALETLRAAAVAPRCTPLVAQCGGVVAIVEAVLDPTCKDLEMSFVLSLLLLLNDPATRAYVHPALALERLLAPFTTDMEGKPPTEGRMRKWRAASRAITTIVRSWAGLLLLSADRHGIASLMALLHQPLHPSLATVLLRMIALMLHPPTHPGFVSVLPDGLAGLDEEDGGGADGDDGDAKGDGKDESVVDKSAMAFATDGDVRRRGRDGRGGGGGAAAGGGDGAGSPYPRGYSTFVAFEAYNSARVAPRATAGALSAVRLLDTYIAVLLCALLDGGLVQALSLLCTHSQKVRAHPPHACRARVRV